MNDQDIKKLTDRVTELENESLGTDPAIHPITFQNLKYQVGLLGSGIEGRSTGPTTTSYNGNTLSKVDFATNGFAVGITWDASGHGFKCLTAGYYQVNAAVFFTGTKLNDILDVLLYKNSAPFAKVSRRNAVAGSESVALSDIVNLAVGDEVYLYINDELNNYSISSTPTVTYLSICKV